MARTTPERVGSIIELDEDIDLEEYILAANELVTELCEPVMQPDGATAYYSEPRLALIETWLAAHFYAIRDPRTSFEQAGSVNARYEGKTDLGLNFTRYGQQAMLLDTYGNLKRLNENKKLIKPSISWLGTPPSDYYAETT